MTTTATAAPASDSIITCYLFRMGDIAINVWQQYKLTYGWRSSPRDRLYATDVMDMAAAENTVTTFIARRHFGRAGHTTVATCQALENVGRRYADVTTGRRAFSTPRAFGERQARLPTQAWRAGA